MSHHEKTLIIPWQELKSRKRILLELDLPFRNWATKQENRTLSHASANNKGVDQPAHVRSLISAFVIRSLESIITHVFSFHVFS